MTKQEIVAAIEQAGKTSTVGASKVVMYFDSVEGYKKKAHLLRDGVKYVVSLHQVKPRQGGEIEVGEQYPSGYYSIDVDVFRKEKNNTLFR